MIPPGAMDDTSAKTFDSKKKVTWHNVCPACGVESNNTIEIESWAAKIITGGETKNLCESCAKKEKEAEEEERRQNRMIELLAHVEIPKNFYTWDVKLGNSKLARLIRDNRDKSMYIAGENNCGKTRAAAYNLLLEVRSGKWCRYMRFSELAASYARVCKIASEEAQAHIAGLLDDNAVLLIDDIGKRRITENAGELLYELFDRLYAGDAKTLIWCTANLNSISLAERFENRDIGDAVSSRIDRMIDAGTMVKIEAGKDDK